MSRYWILNISTDFSTIDDLRLGHHGWNYDDRPRLPVIQRGDIAILFDSKKLMFCGLGRFMAGVSMSVSKEAPRARYDFLVDVTSRRESKRDLRTIKKLLVLPKNTIRGSKWLAKVFTPLTRAEFNDLMSAWWGVTEFASEVDIEAARYTTGNHLKYSAYTYAFQRIEEAVERGFYLEAVAIAESLISDRLMSACRKAGQMPKRSTLSELIDAARYLVPPIPREDEFHSWRENRNRVLHGMVKPHKKSPLLAPPDFLELSERTAYSGMKLARVASNWEKKVKAQRLD